MKNLLKIKVDFDNENLKKKRINTYLFDPTSLLLAIGVDDRLSTSLSRIADDAFRGFDCGRFSANTVQTT